MHSNSFMRGTALTAALAALAVLALASTSDAGWRRGSCGRGWGWGSQMQRYNTVQQINTVQPVAPVQPAQPVAPATAAGSQYQSFSYEPVAPAPVPVVGGAVAGADSNSNARSFYRGDYRVQPNDRVPNMFRADRKILGLQSN